MQVWSLGREDPLDEGMATHSSILAWKIPWTEEPNKLQPIGSQRVGRDWATEYARKGRSIPGNILGFSFIWMLLSLCEQYRFQETICTLIMTLWTHKSRHKNAFSIPLPLLDWHFRHSWLSEKFKILQSRSPDFTWSIIFPSATYV